MKSPKKSHSKGKGSKPHPVGASDLAVILRAADDLNQRGGRELLVQVLKGATDARLRRLGLEQCPVFGIYETQELAQIDEKINQVLEKGYLQLEMTRQGERIHLTPAGEEIEHDTLAVELLADFDELLDTGFEIDFSQFSDTKIETQRRLLDLVAARGDQRYLRLLAAWEPFAPRKLRRQIETVQQNLEIQEDKI
jgi:superfamily II DNA helicase RecQ